MSDSPRRVCLIAWFLNEDRHWLGEWLDPNDYDVGYVGLPIKVDITQPRTGLIKWLQYGTLALKARWHLAHNDYDVIVTTSPQVAMMVELVNMVSFKKVPHVAWYFNCGHKYHGPRLWLSRIVFPRIKNFIVYTNKERENYSDWFGVPRERFVFTHLTGVPLDASDYGGTREKYGLADRYISSLGSSSRDFRTLFEATRDLGVQVVVVTHRYALEAVEVPDHVKVIESIPQHDYLGIIAESTVVAIPLDNVHTASGQMTLIQAMGLGVPVVSTKCIGTEDYIEDGETGFFAELGDAADMRERLRCLLNDEDRRETVATAARKFAEQHFFDDAGARLLDRIFPDASGQPGV